jgi:hypothetical protein
MTRRRQAIHVRHREIHDDDVGPAKDGLIYRGAAVARRDDATSHRAQVLAIDGTCISIIVDDQH